MRNPDPFSLLVSLWHLSELCVYTATVSPVLGFILGTLLLPGVDEKVESVVTKSDTFFMAHCQPTNAFHSSLRRVRAEKEPSCVGSGTYLANWFVKFPFQLRLRGMNGVREITFFFFLLERRNCVPRGPHNWAQRRPSLFVSAKQDPHTYIQIKGLWATWMGPQLILLSPSRFAELININYKAE